MWHAENYIRKKAEIWYKESPDQGWSGLESGSLYRLQAAAALFSGDEVVAFHGGLPGRHHAGVHGMARTGVVGHGLGIDRESG